MILLQNQLDLPSHLTGHDNEQKLVR